MLNGRKVVVVMPAYNAARTLRRTYEELPRQVVDAVVVVDDASDDGTASLARELGAIVVAHERNLGYGGNQKTCYRAALQLGAGVVVMIHPDYQYSPRLVTALAAMVAYGEYDVALGSRVLCGGARAGGMPLYKYVANRALTWLENLLVGARLSEYHTGLRAYARSVLEALPLAANSDDFVFDNQILAQAIYFGWRIGEISCPTRYFPEASSIGFARSVSYGLSVLATALAFRLQRWRIARFAIFDPPRAKVSSALP
ncbi:MAG: glycosyltransferase family 2 protein [Candidatus Eremiobacteraeota bacterium]|nr:glycosyltransferase family 2 protein [Candidatus Eremiobacteraeota bacterium]